MGTQRESGRQPHENTQQREVERGGSAAAPDAPTDVEENPGLSTVLSADTFSGVQSDDEDDES